MTDYLLFGLEAAGNMRTFVVKNSAKGIDIVRGAAPLLRLRMRRARRRQMGAHALAQGFHTKTIADEVQVSGAWVVVAMIWLCRCSPAQQLNTLAKFDKLVLG